MAKILVTALIFSLLAVPFLMFSQKELAPIEDEASINVAIEALTEVSLEYTTAQMHDVVDTLLQLPGSTKMWQIVLPTGGFGGMSFIDFNQRDFNVKDLLPQAFGALSQITGVTAFPILPPSLPSAGQFDVELVIQSPDSYEDMQPFANTMVQKAFASGKFMFAATDLKIDLPQVRLRIDRDRVADLGMTMQAVNDQITTLLSGTF